MPAATPFQPDNLYCVYCHALADGPCATCGAIICADCGVVSGGAVQIAVVCRQCDRGGRGRVGLRAWSRVLVLLVGLAAGLAALAWLVAGGVAG